MAVKNITIKDKVTQLPVTTPIGAEAQNIVVSFDSNGDIIEDITASGITVDHVEPLSETLQDLKTGQDISGKADKVNNAVNGHFAGLDSSGNITDSGYNAGQIPVNPTSTENMNLWIEVDV